jgi:ABC-type transport system substrate-binding protein
VIAAQPRARRLVEIVRFNAQDAREFSDPLVRDAIASAASRRPIETIVLFGHAAVMYGAAWTAERVAERLAAFLEQGRSWRLLATAR